MGADARRLPRFIVLLPILLAACVTHSSPGPTFPSPLNTPTVVTPTASAPAAPTPPTLTPSARPALTTPVASPCLAAAVYPSLSYPTPSPSDGIPFKSTPEPGTNLVYTGRIALSPRLIGIQINLILLVTNDGSAPLTLNQGDFSFTSISRRSAVPFQFYDEQASTKLSRIIVAPGEILRVLVGVTVGPDDLKAIWQIKGSLGTVDIPLLMPAPLVFPTEPPQKCFTLPTVPSRTGPASTVYGG